MKIRCRDMLIFSDLLLSPKINCSLVFKPCPLSVRAIWLAESERWCCHRSECPFTCALGRWTPHLISNKGNFSIFHPVYSDTATNLGFFIASLHLAGFFCDFPNLFTVTGLWLLLQWTLQRGPSAKSLHLRKTIVVFVPFFGSVEFLCWSESMGAQFSKTAAKGETVAEKPGEAAASPTKTNGQVNVILCT